ncbi:MAG: response regulator transcription factor [Bacteroidales bacterium]|nr:response regulator transcription factor [Bacteroidales bacterium]
MDKITIGIYDEHRLTQEGIQLLLQNSREIEVVFNVFSKEELNNSLSTKKINILIINVHKVNTSFLNQMMQITINYPSVKTLITSVHDDEEMILKVIKCGAKGFLAKESGFSELSQAIFMLRNGHEYYSDSITHLLLKKYISKIQSDTTEGYSKINSLSSREIEIVRLWGDSLTNKEIADRLFISVRTVESHKNHIMQKLNLKTAVDLVKFAIRNNIIEIG